MISLLKRFFKTRGYKLGPKLRTDIIEYLKTRPFDESDMFLKTMFEIENKNPMFTERATKKLFTYLRSKPREEVKHIFESTETEVEAFILSKNK